MISYKQAKKIALKTLNSPSRVPKLSLYEPGVSFEYGWIFYYDQEGVFHPKLPEINSKIRRWLSSGKLEDEIRLLLSEKEVAIMDSSLGLSGQLPLFVDKETAEILFVKGSVETIKQVICKMKGKR